MITKINTLNIARYIGSYDERLDDNPYDDLAIVLVIKMSPFVTTSLKIQKESYAPIRGVLPGKFSHHLTSIFASWEAQIQNIYWIVETQLHRSFR